MVYIIDKLMLTIGDIHRSVYTASVSINVTAMLPAFTAMQCHKSVPICGQNSSVDVLYVDEATIDIKP